MQKAGWKDKWRFGGCDMHGTMFALNVVKICINITDVNVDEVNTDKKIVLYALSKKKIYLHATGCTFFFPFHWIKFRGVAVAVIYFCGLRFLKIKIRGFVRQNSQQRQEPRVIIARQWSYNVCLFRRGTSFLPQANIMISYYTKKQSPKCHPFDLSEISYRVSRSINELACAKTL